MKLSIIIPTYNRSNLIKNAILHLLGQSYKNIEIIVVDDCSIDDTQSIVSAINDNRVRYLRNDKNYGAEISELRAIKHCSGEFITFIADDDKYIDNSFFEEAMNNIISDNQIDIVNAKVETVFNNTRIENSFHFQDINDTFTILNNFHIYYQQFTIGGNTIFRKSLFNGFSTKSHNDNFTVFKLIYNSRKIRFINKVVFLWYAGSVKDTFCTRLAKEPYLFIKRELEFMDQVTNFLEHINDLERFKPMINKYVLESFENVKMNYMLSSNESLFHKLLKQVLGKSKIYIYGKGILGTELNKFFITKNILIKGFIDDHNTQDVVSIQEIDSEAIIIIATYKDRLQYKMYKKLISSGISYHNILEFI